MNYNQDTSFASVRAKRATTLPKQFEVTTVMATWAHENFPQVDIKAESEKFRDHHLAKGSKFKSWEAAWRTWIRNADKFQTERAAFAKPQQRPGVHNMAAPLDPYADLEVATWR